MAKFFLILGLFFLPAYSITESIYSHSVMSIEGVNKPLSAYQGRKMMIITLPIQRNASSDSLLQSLDSLRNALGDSLRIIGVPAYEDGFSISIKDSLKQWYRSILHQDIIITEGLYTKKTSGANQHPLFKWLTDKGKNNHFDEDVAGPGDKFFVWNDGELVGLLRARTKIGSTTLNTLLQGQ